MELRLLSSQQLLWGKERQLLFQAVQWGFGVAGRRVPVRGDGRWGRSHSHPHVLSATGTHLWKRPPRPPAQPAAQRAQRSGRSRRPREALHTEDARGTAC